MADDLWLVVGLGNPGPTYSATRHNLGFMVLDSLAARVGSKFKAHKGRCDVVEGRVNGVRTILAKPKSYMNLSGGPTASMRDFFKIPMERIIVVHDELDIPFGSIKLKRGGGDGGHNGLKSITNALGSREYLRVRVGIGRPAGQQDPADYVLKEFAPAERKELPLQIELGADAVEKLLVASIEAVQNEIH